MADHGDDSPAMPGPPPRRAPIASDPGRWGRVDDDGTVWLRHPDGERAIGSWQAGSVSEGLAHYGRRYDDLITEIDLLGRRLDAGTAEPRHTAAAIAKLLDSLSGAAALGDIDAARSRLEGLAERAGERVSEQSAERARRAQTGQAAQRALADEAEQLAAEATHWKAAGDRLRDIVTEFSKIHGTGRAGGSEQSKRITTARETFHRRRGAHFASLDAERKVAESEKERLVAVVESMADSAEWGPTASKMKDAMSQWKAAGKAPREVESQLWERFRAAQDVFFHARSAAFSARDKEVDDLRAEKAALVAEAEKLTVSNGTRALAALRSLQARYDAEPRLPRAAAAGLDARMDAVDRRIRSAIEDHREEAAAASNPMLDQLRTQVERAEHRLERARIDGDSTRIADAEQALASGKQYLSHAMKSR